MSGHYPLQPQRLTQDFLRPDILNADHPDQQPRPLFLCHLVNFFGRLGILDIVDYIIQTLYFIFCRFHSLLPCLMLFLKGIKQLYGIGEMCALPVLSMVRLSFLLPVRTGYSRSRKSLKLFGTWTAIAVIQAL